MASTGLVYDHNVRRPAQESDPAAAEAPYPASKLAAEQELQESGLTWSILRLGFVYGDVTGICNQLPDSSRAGTGIRPRP